MNNLLVAPCSYKASKYSCENYHYSNSIPCGGLFRLGVWEDNKFKGSVIFSKGANNNIGAPYDLEHTQICELTRVALREHEAPVTQIISKSLKLLHQNNPKLELVISYSDLNQEHIGIIYQAGNWIYEGYKKVTPNPIINGEKIHTRTVAAKYSTNDMNWIKEHVDKNAHYAEDKGRHKYLYPLTKKARKKYSYLHKHYPKQL